MLEKEKKEKRESTWGREGIGREGDRQTNRV